MKRFARWCPVAVVLLAAAPGPMAVAQSLAPIAPTAPEPPPAPSQPALLRTGETVTLRIRQVIPCDGLSPGERQLNGMYPIARGDRIVAEVVDPCQKPPALIGGTIAHVARPRRFGKPGRVMLELGQLVQKAPGQDELVPWVFDLEDRRFNVQMRRRILLSLFALEGLGLGASLGAQASPGSPVWVGGAAGLGLLAGIGYASLIPGRDATLEPGDTFQITVGTLSYRPIEPSPPLSLHPAPDPAKPPRKEAH